MNTFVDMSLVLRLFLPIQIRVHSIFRMIYWEKYNDDIDLNSGLWPSDTAKWYGFFTPPPLGPYYQIRKSRKKFQSRHLKAVFYLENYMIKTIFGVRYHIINKL
jgi:hypothetical protein